MSFPDQDDERAERIETVREQAECAETDKERSVKEAIAEYCANNPDTIDREFANPLPEAVHEALQDPDNWHSMIDDVREGVIDAAVVDEPDPYGREHRYEFRHPKHRLASLRAYPTDVEDNEVTVRVQGE